MGEADETRDEFCGCACCRGPGVYNCLVALITPTHLIHKRRPERDERTQAACLGCAEIIHSLYPENAQIMQNYTCVEQMVWRYIEEGAPGSSARWQTEVEWTLIDTIAGFDDDWYKGVLTWTVGQGVVHGSITCILDKQVQVKSRASPVSLAALDGCETWHLTATVASAVAEGTTSLFFSVVAVCPQVAAHWIYTQSLNTRKFAVALADMSLVDIDYYILSRVREKRVCPAVKAEQLKQDVAVARAAKTETTDRASETAAAQAPSTGAQATMAGKTRQSSSSALVIMAILLLIALAKNRTQ